MKNSRQFVFIFLTLVGVFFLFHLVMWKTVTEKIFERQDNIIVGDLGRMSYQVDYIKTANVEIPEYPKGHVPFYEWKGEPIDMITVGDSFSQVFAEGYQDAIVNRYDLSVMNVQQYQRQAPLETIIAMYNNGMLDEIKPKAVLIEVTGKFIAKEFAHKNLDFSLAISKEALNDAMMQSPFVPWNAKTGETLKMVNTGNYKAFIYKMLYPLNDHAFFSKVYIVDLNKPMFEIGESKKLLFFDKDLAAATRLDAKVLERVNSNFNRLAGMLSQKGIRLYMMVAVDKYDIYHKYFVNRDQYPENPLFETMRPMEKAYTFIDTKKILEAEVAKGDKDIFYPDDTHWTPKAAALVVKNVDFGELKK